MKDQYVERKYPSDKTSMSKKTKNKKKSFKDIESDYDPSLFSGVPVCHHRLVVTIDKLYRIINDSKPCHKFMCSVF